MEKFTLYKKEFLEKLPESEKSFLKKLCDYSSCLCDFLFRHEEYVEQLYKELDKPLYGREKLVDLAFEFTKDATDESTFIRKLTEFKMLHFGRILTKDIYSKHSLPELMEEYSYLADATIEVALDRALKAAEKRYGTPLEDGKTAEPLVVALGKLGGRELNYYSDIDIMYLYSSDGKTSKGFSNREFFTFLFSKLTTFLTKKNIEGQTWIVDLDLRPNGKAGFLTYPLSFIENYYWISGRVWERFMLIKARHAAGSQKLFEEFYKIINPFVYRRFTSKEEVEEILKIKDMIHQSTSEKEGFDLKKGEGGIRTIEFTVQILQLLYGGKIKQLQEQSTLKALRKLRKLSLLRENQASILEEAYLFYRRLEHYIQVENCIQTQFFRYSKAEEFAKKLGLQSGKELLEKLNYYRENVRKIFDELKLPTETQVKVNPVYRHIITKHFEEEALDFLEKLGFKDQKSALHRIKEIFQSKDFILLAQDLKEKLLMFLNDLPHFIESTQDKDEFILNLNKMLINGRLLSVFAFSLQENPKLSDTILEIARLSDYISDIISKEPDILDIVFNITKEVKTFEDLQYVESLIEIEDLLQRLNKLKKVIEVSVAIEFLTSQAPQKEKISKLNNELSLLADYVLTKLYNRYDAQNLGVYALGKLGSREMNIGSDLDLVFAFLDATSKEKYKSIPERIIKDLTSYTSEGILYQIDLRLRPYGKAGELSPTVSFYKNYFSKDARSWERLAWVKSRFIVGDEKVQEKIEELINNFLFEKPIDKTFIEEIYDMRLKLEGLANEKRDEVDIKLGKGGLADVEFVAQLEMLKNKDRGDKVLDAIQKFDLPFLDDFLFLRDLETRLRMVKGNSVSKVSRNSPAFKRVAGSIGVSPEEYWEKLQKVRENVRKNFNRYFKQLKEG